MKNKHGYYLRWPCRKNSGQKKLTFVQHRDIIDDVPVLTQKDLKVQKQPWLLLAMTIQEKFQN